jgi:dolichyl-phosphate-mannose--protein O-mannosyl transferase
MLLETAQSKHVLLDNEVYHSGAKEDMTNRWELVINKKKKEKKKGPIEPTKTKLKIYIHIYVLYT